MKTWFRASQCSWCRDYIICCLFLNFVLLSWHKLVLSGHKKLKWESVSNILLVRKSVWLFFFLINDQCGNGLAHREWYLPWEWHARLYKKADWASYGEQARKYSYYMACASGLTSNFLLRAPDLASLNALWSGICESKKPFPPRALFAMVIVT